MAYGGRLPYTDVLSTALGGGTGVGAAPVGDSTGYLTRLQRLRPLLNVLGKQPGPAPMIPQSYGGGRRRGGTEDEMEQALQPNYLASLMFMQPRTMSRTVQMGSGHPGGYRTGAWFDQPHDQGPGEDTNAAWLQSQEYMNPEGQLPAWQAKYGPQMGLQMWMSRMNYPGAKPFRQW